MKRLILITALSLGLATTALAQNLPPHLRLEPGEERQQCAQLLPLMAQARTAVRSKRPLTTEQDHTWKSWQAVCQHAPWPQRLTALDDPAEVAQYYDRTPSKIYKEFTPNYYRRGQAPVMPSDFTTPAPSYYVPSYSGPSPSRYISCIPLANGSWGCY